uniref:Membrane-bound transcription factor site-1 protease-like N-terminal domain-containing protein n=1 Tax=Biomphalaria glabrata TaxID=6526 RepID=A0A2C9JIP8_BIOGL
MRSEILYCTTLFLLLACHLQGSFGAENISATPANQSIDITTILVHSHPKKFTFKLDDKENGEINFHSHEFPKEEDRSDVKVKTELKLLQNADNQSFLNYSTTINSLEASSNHTSSSSPYLDHASKPTIDSRLLVNDTKVKKGFKKDKTDAFLFDDLKLTNTRKYEHMQMCNSSFPGQTERLDIEFASSIVDNEYIVTFNGYYKTQARKRFITAAMQEAGITSWKILPRINPANTYPSDFDVIQFHGQSDQAVEAALKDHPLIKRVTPHKKVTRSLKFTKVNDNDEPEADDSGAPHHINTFNSRNAGRKSLSTPAMWLSPSKYKSRKLLRAVPKQWAIIRCVDTGQWTIITVVGTGQWAIIRCVDTGQWTIIRCVGTGQWAIIRCVDTGQWAIITLVGTGQWAIITLVGIGQWAIITVVGTGQWAIIRCVDTGQWTIIRCVGTGQWAIIRCVDTGQWAIITLVGTGQWAIITLVGIGHGPSSQLLVLASGPSSHLLVLASGPSSDVLILTSGPSSHLLVLASGPSSQLLVLASGPSSQLLVLASGPSSDVLILASGPSSDVLVLASGPSSDVLILASGPSSHLLVLASGSSSHLLVLASGSSSHLLVLASRPSSDVLILASGPSSHLLVLASGPSSHLLVLASGPSSQLLVLASGPSSDVLILASGPSSDVLILASGPSSN